jgi:hypothetical protein
MLQFVIVAASWLEIVVGLLFLFVPELANVCCSELEGME